jgi:hypothetical protein
MERVDVTIWVRAGEPFVLSVSRDALRQILAALSDLEPKWVSIAGGTMSLHLCSDDILAITYEHAVIQPVEAN